MGQVLKIDSRRSEGVRFSVFRPRGANFVILRGAGAASPCADPGCGWDRLLVSGRGYDSGVTVAPDRATQTVFICRDDCQGRACARWRGRSKSAY